MIESNTPSATLKGGTSSAPESRPLVLHTRVVSGEGGGPEKTILNSPRYLERLGYRALCAYMYPPGDSGIDVLAHRAQSAGATIVPVPDRGPWDWRVVQSLLIICRANRVAIWHGHDYKSNALGLLLRRFWPMHLVTTVHGWVKFTRRTPLYYAIDRYCLRRYEKVICVSDDLLEMCRSAHVPEDRILLIENAIETDVYRRTMSVSEAKSQLGLQTDRFVIGAAGRLSQEKGFDLLIRAVAELVQRGHNLQLVIAGEGDFRPSLEQLIYKLSLCDRVKLEGFQANLLPLYQACDVFALSSLREGLPNVLLEAMALEVPVVATRVGGIARLIESDVNGLLVTSGEVATLVDAIGCLVGATERRLRLGTAGRRTIEERYGFDRRMRKVCDVYDELLESRG